MANNAAFALGPIAPSVCQNGTIVTPGTTDYNPPLTSLWIGGTVAVTLQLVLTQTGTVTLHNVPAGEMFDGLAILNVGTATTATDIVGFW